MMAAPAGAQTQSSHEPSPTENAVGALSPASLARIRSTLEANRRRERSGRTVFGDPDDGWIVPPRPPVELAPGLGFIEGLGLYRDLTRGREPAPMGGPGHWAMMYQMTPREATEVAQADGLAIGTAAVSALPLHLLVPRAIQKIAGWFSGAGSRSRPAPPAHPVLTSAQKAAVLEDIRANTGVVDATLRQDGRTVALSLLVPAETEPRAAREVGERFVRLVGRRAAAGPDAFDYVVSVRSPDAVIAHGGKPTSEPLVRW